MKPTKVKLLCRSSKDGEAVVGVWVDTVNPGIGQSFAIVIINDGVVVEELISNLRVIDKTAKNYLKENDNVNHN
jgi:hypothetical protein